MHQGNDKNFHVLITEDDADVRIITKLSLSRIAHLQVSEAANGAEAISQVTSNNFDVILLDVMMPGMDGHEVCRRLKRDPKTADIPVIFLTARNEREDEELGFELGAVDYLVKPVNADELAAKIRAFG